MNRSEGFHNLEAQFAALESATSSNRDDLGDRIKSLRYFAVDRSIENGGLPDDPSVRIRSWVLNVRFLEDEIVRRGGMPQSNQPGGEHNSRRVLWWRADQLRPATRSLLCSYQTKRLEGLNGFSWAPFDDKWEVQFELYLSFVSVRQAPRYRAGGVERRIARWAQAQRDLYRRGALDPTRILRLEGTRFWSW
jgi:hypothetical protein